MKAHTPKKEGNPPQPSDGISDLEKEQLKFLMESSRTISLGITQRVELQQKLLNFQIIFIGIIAAFATRYSSSLNSVEALPALSIVPIILLFFIWAHTNHDMMIIGYARYLRHHLNPKIKTIVRVDIIEFEDFLSRYRKRNYSILSILGGEYNLAILTTILAVSIAAQTAFSPTNSAVVWFGLKIGVFRAMVIGEILALILSIVIRIIVGKRYLGISDPDP